MPRIARDARIETRDARSRLKARPEPYWRQIHPGLAVGYYKGPRGGAWFVRRLEAGRYEKKRLGKADDRQNANGLDVLDYKQAHRRAVESSDQAAQRTAGTAELNREYTVGDACDDYLAWFKLHRKSEADTRRVVDAHIRPALGARPVVSLTAKQIGHWRDRLAQAPARQRGPKALRPLNAADPETMRRRKASTNRILTVLKAALNHAYHEGVVQSADEWRKVKPFHNVDQPRIRYLSTDECTRLVNACPADLRALVRAALLTGARYGELTRLEAADYNPDAGTVLVRESKGGRVRHIPLTDEGQRFFTRATAGLAGNERIFTRKDGQPWGRSHQARPMREASEAAKISPPVSFHAIRHTYGSLLAMRGVSLQVIAQALGHADTRMTERHYAHLQPSYVADTIRAHLPSFGIEADNVAALRPGAAEGGK